MEIFEVVNNHAFPSVHALLIEPFKTIWESDVSEGKTDSIKKFTYIELMCSPRKSNPYYGLPEDAREKELKKQVWGNERPSGVPDIIRAIDKYKALLEISSPTYSLLTAAYTAKDKLVKFLTDLDPAAKTNSGVLILKPKDVSAALKDVFEVVKSLDSARTKMNQELTEETRMRSQRTPGFYEE